jgi:methyl-accepting chemotaxis protein
MAQESIDQTSAVVADQLRQVVDHFGAVRAATGRIDQRVEAAHDATRSMVDQARQAEQVVVALSNSLRRVGGIAQLIASVADQTNLLALNATIEAARAGEAGRGFAIVASEVKDLATTTSQSTGDIASILQELERDTGAVSTAITTMTDGIRGINDTTAEFRDVAEEQRDTVEQLGQQVEDAIQRVRTLGQSSTAG